MDWFPTYDEIRAMLDQVAPELSVDDIEHMTIGEVWIALGRALGVPPRPGQQTAAHRHTDCAAADHRAKAQNRPAVRCYTDDREDCFGK